MPSIKVLGAYGSKGVYENTTCIQISANSVMDAGNIIDGLGDAARDIDNIFITHCHFDHLLDVPFMLDAFFATRDRPYKVYALGFTIEAIKKHLLNGMLWPDFSTIKLLRSDSFAIEFVELEVDKEYIFEDFAIRPIMMDHSVPCCGFVLTKESKSILVCADTYPCDSITKEINSNPKITTALIECSFPSTLAKLARDSKHLTPQSLSQLVETFRRDVDIHINHLKPTYEKAIIDEISTLTTLANCHITKDMTTIYF